MLKQNHKINVENDALNIFIFKLIKKYGLWFFKFFSTTCRTRIETEGIINQNLFDIRNRRSYWKKNSESKE
jgi:hypothetical protein